MTGAQRKRIHEAAGTPVVIGPVALVLIDLLLVGTRSGEAGGIAREAVRLAVHHVRLVPVLGRQEFEVEARIAFQFSRDRLVQINVNPDGLALRRHDKARVEVVVRIAQADFDGARLAVHGADGRLGDEVPLLRRVGQAHGAALHGAHAVVDDLDAGILLVIEAAGERVAVHQHIHALALKVLKIIEFQVRRRRAAAGRKGHQGKEKQK